jgi:hypothetical protein
MTRERRVGAETVRQVTREAASGRAPSLTLSGNLLTTLPTEIAQVTNLRDLTSAAIS